MSPVVSVAMDAAAGLWSLAAALWETPVAGLLVGLAVVAVHQAWAARRRRVRRNRYRVAADVGSWPPLQATKPEGRHRRHAA